MFKTADLIDWFGAQAASLPNAIAFSLNELPDGEPNRACAIRRSGGLGLELEDALDRPSFRLLTRGVNMRDAEVLMLSLDALFIDAPPSFYIGASRVIGKGRFGDPSYVGEDPNELFPGRFIFSGAYWCRVERNGSGGG